MRQRKSPLLWDRRNIVGIVDSPAAASAAAALPVGAVDAFELRLDCLDPADTRELAASLAVPILATARDPREGGVGNLTGRDRAAWLTTSLEFANIIDIELANASEFETLIRETHTYGIQVVLSHHNFSGTISLERALELAAEAKRFGADLFKLAVTPTRATELCALIALPESAPLPVATMGMGKFGKISRLACAAAGSALNYGWLETPNVQGQWSALELNARFAELGIRPA